MKRDYAKRISKKKPKKGRKLLVLILIAALIIWFWPTILDNSKNGWQRVTGFFAKKDSTSKKSDTAKKLLAAAEFEFYNITNNQNTQENSPTSYELEIAIVDDFASADNLKARLTLLGFAVSITPIYQDGTKKYYVSIGPYQNRDATLVIQKKLKDEKITAKLKKLSH